MATSTVEIEQIFSPAAETTEPKRFAGRSGIVEKIVSSLKTEGAHIVLFGDRGVGKSSLAHQIIKMAGGNKELMLQNALDAHNFEFAVQYFNCSDSIQSIDDLLSGILSDNSGIASLANQSTVKKIEANIEGHAGVNIGVAKMGAKDSVKTTTEIRSIDPNIIATFNNVVQDILRENAYKNGILLVIDEFDRIKHKVGFASFMKSLGHIKKLKFVIVGIAKDLDDLLNEHASVERQLNNHTLRVPRMTSLELKEIFTIAEKDLSNSIVFQLATKERIISISNGLPYYIHLLGGECLKKAKRKLIKSIPPTMVDEIISEIGRNPDGILLERNYRRAVTSSYSREYVLKAMAAAVLENDGAHYIRMTAVYKDVLQNLGKDKKSVNAYIGQLVGDDYSPVIVKWRGKYQFIDALFHSYARARPFLLNQDDDDEDSDE